MNKSELKAIFINAKATDAKYIGVSIQTEGSSQPEIIINPNANFDAKFDYYMEAYDDDLILIAAKGKKDIRITAAGQGNRFEDIECQLLGERGKATNPPTEQENGENGANTEPDKATEEQPEDKVIIPQGKMKVTVICDGSLNIRRSAEWGNENICGRAIRGQSYYVKEIHVVDGKKMVRTIGDLYLSGESEHVQFEQL